MIHHPCPHWSVYRLSSSLLNVFLCFLPACGGAPPLMCTWWTAVWQIESVPEGHPRLTVLSLKAPPPTHPPSPLNQDFTISSRWPPGASRSGGRNVGADGGSAFTGSVITHISQQRATFCPEQHGRLVILLFCVESYNKSLSSSLPRDRRTDKSHICKMPGLGWWWRRWWWWWFLGIKITVIPVISLFLHFSGLDRLSICACGRSAWCLGSKFQPLQDWLRIPKSKG